MGICGYVLTCMEVNFHGMMNKRERYKLIYFLGKTYLKPQVLEVSLQIYHLVCNHFLLQPHHHPTMMAAHIMVCHEAWQKYLYKQNRLLLWSTKQKQMGRKKDSSFPSLRQVL